MLPLSSLPAALVLLLAAASGPQEAARSEPAARAGQTVVSWERYDRLLVDRYALSESGRLTLHHLLKAKVLDHLAAQVGLVVGEAEVDARTAELEREAGGSKSFREVLREQGISQAQFRRYLRLGIVQERLARRELGIAADDPISGEQQELWLESVMSAMGVAEHPAPWSQGPVVACGPVLVELDEFLSHLRDELEEREQRTALYQLLLERRVAGRMPDLSPAAVDAAVRAEVERRRLNVESDPKYQGLSYEQLLRSQGIRFEAWADDPSVRIQALSQLWVERSYDDDDLKRVYEDEREHFAGTYGEAIEVWAILLKAVQFENELLQRTFEQAEEQLYELSRGVRSRAEFEALAERLSEDEGTRAEKGRVGWVTRAGQERHAALKAAIFAALDDGRFEPAGDPDSRRRLLGPVRTTSSCVLLWLGARRPNPPWESMARFVREELRVRFLEQTLSPKDVVTYLDVE